jgi:cell wall integrity and stress response component
VTAGSQLGGSHSEKKSSAAGIAAGVIVGVIVLGAIAGGAFFYIRQKRRREIEEEYQRNAAVNSFIGAGKPGSAGSASYTDSRLDPSVVQRRMSDGSIMDNQDYSRRILKVRSTFSSLF